MSLTFATVGLSFYILHNNIQSDFAKECGSKTGIAYTIDQIYEQGADILCSDKCPCNIGNSKSEYKGKSYAGMTFDKQGYNTYLDCPGEILSKTHENKYGMFLRAIETGFDCAGICVQPSLYLFRDLNLAPGPPKQVCKDIMVPFVKTSFDKYQSFIWLVTLIGVFGLAQSAAVCYHKKSKMSQSW